MAVHKRMLGIHRVVISLTTNKSYSFFFETIRVKTARGNKVGQLQERNKDIVFVIPLERHDRWDQLLIAVICSDVYALSTEERSKHN